jgi:hypothetical protein
MLKNEFESDFLNSGVVHLEKRGQRPTAWPKSVNVGHDK